MSRGAVLIRDGWVLSLDPRVGNFTGADVLIRGEEIAEVGPGLRARDAEVVDASDCVVMPGFVDTHRHAWKSLFRHGGGEVLGNAGASGLVEAGRHHQPDDVYAATLIGLLGAVEAGITTVVDWSDVQVDDRHTEAVLQAHADAGLRTVLVPAAPAWAAADLDEPPAMPGMCPPNTTIAFGPRTPAASGLDGAARTWDAARRAGLRVHVHAGGDAADRGLAAALASRGMLGADVTLVHCTSLDEADLDAVASSGSSVVLTPSSEMADGRGAPPVQRLIDRGIRPGLGIDAERMAPGDLFAQMRALISLQHATYFDLKLAGKAGLPNLLTTREVIRYATVDGARAVGLGDVAGTLSPGKQADVLVLRADRPNIWPINDPIGAVVWGMDTSNVDWVFAAGRPLVRAGTMEADMGRARDLAVAARERVAAASGLLTATTTGSAG